jgi:hypothetical protein
VRIAAIILMTALLAGCGVAGTGAATAVGGATSAEEAKAAKKQIESVQADLDAAQKKAAESREAAEQ